MTAPIHQDLPDPLTPADCDLRGLPFMPLEVGRLLDSDMFAESTGDEFKAAVALWCKSWTQIPAASLPNKDKVLAHFSGNAEKWKRIKAVAMRGWILCSDDRWYHPVVAEKALAALPGREEFNHKKSADAERKAREREDRKALFEALKRHGVTPEWNVSTKVLRGMAAQYLSQEPPSHVTDMERDMSHVVTVCKGEGEKKGELTSKSESSSSLPLTLRDDESSKESPALVEGNARNERITALLLAQGIVTTSGNPFVLSWAQNLQVTDEVLNVAIIKAKAAKPGADIPPKYLAKTVETVLEEQSAQLPAMAPPRPFRLMSVAEYRPAPPQGTDPKGLDESYEAYEARIAAAELARRKGCPPQ